jgi:glycosyltransferase involved in cell wall biosynthesis
MRSFHDIYNPLMALQVVSALRIRFPDVKLCMAGSDKGMLADCMRLAAEMSLLRHVSFPGFLDRDSKRQEARKADIFLNTSRIDNMPVALLEAAAFGLPNVTTGVGGIPNLFEHDRSALLVTNESVADMVQQLERVLSEPRLCSRISENGRKVAERSFWSIVKPQWDQVFDELGSQVKR